MVRVEKILIFLSETLADFTKQRNTESFNENYPPMTTSYKHHVCLPQSIKFIRNVY